MNPVVLSIPIFFILIGMEVAYGRYKNRKLYRLNDAITNISCGVVEQLTGVFAKVFTVAAYHFIYIHFAIFELSNTWYWILLCFIGVDFFYYWAHRMSHEVNLFWLGHVVHHQSEEYNLSVALRQSVFQKMFTFYFYFPMALLGFKTEWFVLTGAFNLLYQFWIHTEVIKKLPKWYEYLFNTPSHHRVHHGRNPKYIDRNHSGTLMLWDRMFGSFQKEEETPTYGITSPINSWNPVMANLQPFVLLWKELKTVPGVGNKLKLIFARPGWYPDSMGGFRPPPEVDPKTYQKYDVIISPQLNFYLFAQYVLVLGASASFLFTMSYFTVFLQVLYAVAMIGSVAILGMLFENKAKANLLESIRFLALSGLAFYMFVTGVLPFYVSIVVLIVGLVSLMVLSRIQMHQIKVTT